MTELEYDIVALQLLEIRISNCQAIFQTNLGLPAQVAQAGNIHQLSGRAIRLGRVEFNAALIADDFAHCFSELADGDVFASADVDVRQHGLGVGVVGGFVQIHDVYAGGGHVVDVEEFAHGCAGAPDHDAFGVVDLGFVEAADQRRDDVGVFRVVVVAGAVEVGGHDAAVVGAVAVAVLAVVAFAEFDAGDLGDGVGFVGGFQRACEQGVFAHRLRCEFGVDATAAEEQELLHPDSPGFVDDIGFDHHILIDEFGRVGVVGVDTADLGGGKIDLVGLLGFEEGAHGGLVGEVEFGVGAGDDVGLALRVEDADDGRADHAAMAGDVDFVNGGHACRVSSVLLCSQATLFPVARS